MSTVAVWQGWYEAFEQSVRDDTWERLINLMTPDAQYRVVGAPFACVIKGPHAIAAGFRRSFAGFDRRFDKRTHIVAGSEVTEPGHVEARIWGVYEKSGLPTLAFPATGQWHVDDGRIGLMVDIYDMGLTEAQSALYWMAQHGAALGGLDPRYGD